MWSPFRGSVDKRWRGPSGDAARTVGEFLDGLDYIDERELVGKI